MIKATIAAKVPATKDRKEMTANLSVNWVDMEKDPDAALKEAVSMVGAKAILTNSFANWRVTLQGNIRSGLLKGETPAQIQARLGGAKMGVAQSGARVDAVQAYAAQFKAASPEARKKMIADLQAQVNQ